MAAEQLRNSFMSMPIEMVDRIIHHGIFSGELTHREIGMLASTNHSFRAYINSLRWNIWHDLLEAHYAAFTPYLLSLPSSDEAADRMKDAFLELHAAHALLQDLWNEPEWIKDTLSEMSQSGMAIDCIKIRIEHSLLSDQAYFAMQTLHDKVMDVMQHISVVEDDVVRNITDYIPNQSTAIVLAGTLRSMTAHTMLDIRHNGRVIRDADQISLLRQICEATHPTITIPLDHICIGNNMVGLTERMVLFETEEEVDEKINAEDIILTVTHYSMAATVLGDLIGCPIFDALMAVLQQVQIGRRFTERFPFEQKNVFH